MYNHYYGPFLQDDQDGAPDHQEGEGPVPSDIHLHLRHLHCLPSSKTRPSGGRGRQLGGLQLGIDLWRQL